MSNESTPTPTGGQVELKPCPFCGSGAAPRIATAIELNPEDDSASGLDLCVVCDAAENGCGAACGYRRDKEAVTTLWNTRATDAENAALRERNDTLHLQLQAAHLVIVQGVEPGEDDGEVAQTLHQWRRDRDAELARLREENAKLENDLCIVNDALELGEDSNTDERLAKVREFLALRATNAGLVEVLERYGQHLDTCMLSFANPCSCGLDEAIDAAKGGEA